MDFAVSAEQQMIQDTARSFARGELLALADAVGQGQQREAFLANLNKLAGLGFMGLNVDADYGGSEAGVIGFSLAIKEIAKACASTAVTMSVTNMVAEVIQAVANEEQKANYLPKICSGEYPAGAFCLTEATAGSDPAGMKATAKLDGDEYILNGNKLYITSAEYAGIFVVWALTDKNAAKGKGISCFLVEAGTPGLHISPAEKKMGQHGSATNEVIFDECRIPTSALMGELNQGFKIAVGELAGGRIGVGSLALGIAEAAMDYARAYIVERVQFDQAIADFQGVQWMLSDTYTELEAAKLLLLNAAWCKQQGLNYGKQASMAKLFATEKANQACYTALQLLGGAGYLQDHPLERYARDVRITTIYEGTSEVQKIIIARELLREVAM